MIIPLLRVDEEGIVHNNIPLPLHGFSGGGIGDRINHVGLGLRVVPEDAIHSHAVKDPTGTVAV